MTVQSRSTLYRGGSIYAPGTPRATALLVDGPEIVWIGTDEAAERLGRSAGTSHEVVDLSGALVTPAFVDAHVRWPRTEQPSPPDALPTLRAHAAASGIASLHVMTTPADATTLERSLASEVSPLEHPGPQVDGPEIVAYAPVPASWADGVLGAATAAGTQAVVLVEDAAALDALLDAATRVVENVGLPRFVAARHRAELATGAADATTLRERLDAMARLGLVATVRPLPAEQVRLFRGHPVPELHALAAAGVPLAFGSGASDAPLEPWGAVRAASSAAWGSAALSARAAFAAATRGGRRAARQDLEGALRPGTAATFVVWTHAGELVVRTPDARVAAWSTDPRAATPGLPDLTGDGPDPICRRTVINGVIAHDDGFPA